MYIKSKNYIYINVKWNIPKDKSLKTSSYFPGFATTFFFLNIINIKITILYYIILYYIF